jgi:hypothetical protein
MLPMDWADIAFSGLLGGVMMLVGFMDGSFSRWRNGSESPKQTATTTETKP